MPNASHGFAVSIDKKKVMVVGGHRQRCVEMMDMATKTWTTLASMKRDRYGCAAAVMDGGYVIVVVGRTVPLPRCLMVPPARGPPKLSYRRYFCAMAVVGRKTYVFSGEAQNTVEVFDMETRTWSTMPSMSVIRKGCAAVVLDGDDLVLLVGDSNTAEVFDPVART